MTTPEGRIKAKVKKALIELGAYYFMPVQRGLGASALDYYCCYNTLFVAIETKVPGAKLTPRQLVIAKEIAGCGGIVFVIRGEDDIADMTEILVNVDGTPAIYDKAGDEHTHGQFWKIQFWKKR